VEFGELAAKELVRWWRCGYRIGWGVWTVNRWMEGVGVVATNAEHDEAITEHAAPLTVEGGSKANSGDGNVMAEEARDGSAEPEEEPGSHAPEYAWIQ
jgi:hypothetical protein